MPLYFNIEDLIEVAKWFIIMHRSVVSNRVVIIIVTMHGMELFSERTGFLIADRLALLHFFLESIMLHSNKGTSRIYAHWYTDCLF